MRPDFEGKEAAEPPKSGTGKNAGIFSEESKIITRGEKHREIIIYNRTLKTEY